jgi:3-oxoadipate enol-lactonase
MPVVRVPRTGMEIYYEEAGDGPPLLLIFGFTGNVQGWAMQVPAFSQRFRTITFDNRGVGRSSAPATEYSIRDMAADALGLLDALSIERAHVLGYSMGGQIAQELALAEPGRVDRLVLLSTWARPDTYFSTIIDVWAQLYRQGVDETTRQKFAYTWVLTAAFMATPGVLDQMLALAEANPYKPPAHGIWGQSRAILTSDTRERLPAITAPTLVLVGPNDILTPVKFSEELAREIPTASLRVLERGGHGVIFEATAELNEAVLAFLA